MVGEEGGVGDGDGYVILAKGLFGASMSPRNANHRP